MFCHVTVEQGLQEEEMEKDSNDGKKDSFQWLWC